MKVLLKGENIRMKWIIKFFVAVFIILTVASAVYANTYDGTELVFENKGFELIDQNFNFNLYLNMDTANILVVNSKTNDFWSTTPLDIDLNTSINPFNKNRIKSQLLITVLNKKDIKTIANSFIEVVQKDTIVYEIEDGKITIWYEFGKFSISIPVLYELTEEGLRASIDLNDIIEEEETEEEKRDFRLVKIALNPFFGAEKRGEKGFILIPDGSGAIMEFDAAKTTDVYNSKIYTNDYSLNNAVAHLQNKELPLAMYAMTGEQGSLLGIVTDGEGFGNIVAQQSNAAMGYNYAYIEFDVRLLDEYYLNTQNVNITRKVTYSSEDMYEDSLLEVEYQFLSESTSYVKLAAVYQDYLVKNGILVKNENKTNSLLNLNMYGGVILNKVFLGIPYLAYSPLTTFSESFGIIEAFINKGVSDFNVNYRFWQKDGEFSSGVPNNIRVNSKLEKGLNKEDFIDKVGNLGIDIFWNYDFIQYRPRTVSFEDSNKAVRTISKRYAYILDYFRDTKLEFGWNPSILLSPLYLNEIIESNIKNLPKNISIGSIPSMVFSDIEENGLSTENTIDYFKEALQILSEGRIVLSEKPNQYALADTNIAIGVPVHSSKFINFTYDIPFYQLVVQGYIDYFAEDFNVTANPMHLFLKAIETGSGLSISFTDTEAGILGATKYNTMMNLDYRVWFDFIVDGYNGVKELSRATGNSTIIDHRYIERELVVTEYSNGVSVIVNYSKMDMRYADIEVPAMDFVIVK